MLGPLLSAHPVDTRSRWTSGLLGALSVVLALALATHVILEPFGDKTDGKMLGVAVVMLGIGGWIGSVQLTRAVRGGWRESFDVHKHGLVHHGWRERSWTWRQVTGIRVRWRGNNSLIFGWHLRCVIQFDDGARVCVDGSATDARRIAKIVVARCPAAVRTDPTAAWRLVPYLIPFFALTSAGLTWYLGANSGQEVVETGPYWSRLEPILSETEITLLALAMAVSFVGLFFTIYLFAKRPRD